MTDTYIVKKKTFKFVGVENETSIVYDFNNPFCNSDDSLM